MFVIQYTKCFSVLLLFSQMLKGWGIFEHEVTCKYVSNPVFHMKGVNKILATLMESLEVTNMIQTILRLGFYNLHP